MNGLVQLKREFFWFHGSICNVLAEFLYHNSELAFSEICIDTTVTPVQLALKRAYYWIILEKMLLKVLLKSCSFLLYK